MSSFKSSPQQQAGPSNRRRQGHTARKSYQHDGGRHSGNLSFSSHHHSTNSASGGMRSGGSPQKNESYYKRKSNRNGGQKSRQISDGGQGWAHTHSQPYAGGYQQPVEQPSYDQRQHDWPQADYYGDHDGAEEWNRQHHNAYYYGADQSSGGPPRKHYKMKLAEQQRWGSTSHGHQYSQPDYYYGYEPRSTTQYSGRNPSTTGQSKQQQHDYAQFYAQGDSSHEYYREEHDNNYYDYQYQWPPQQQRRWLATDKNSATQHQSHEAKVSNHEVQHRLARKSDEYQAAPRWQAKNAHNQWTSKAGSVVKGKQQGATTLQWRLKRKRDREPSGERLAHEDMKSDEQADNDASPVEAVQDLMQDVDEDIEQAHTDPIVDECFVSPPGKIEPEQVNDDCSVEEEPTAGQQFSEEMRRPSPATATGRVLLFTDEHIPNQTTKLLVDAEQTKGTAAVPVTSDLLEDSQQVPTVQQKYDLVSNHSSSKKKQANKDADEQLEEGLRDCCFPQGVNGPEPTDSECPLEQMSMRSTQTIQNQIRAAEQENNGLLVRRTNSQENRVTDQFLNQSSSQSVFAASQGFHLMSQSMANLQLDASTPKRIEAPPAAFGDASIRSFGKPASSAKGGSTSGASERGILKHKLFKGVKLSKIRIIEKTTVYIIGLSPKLADKSTMIRFEYFGQYGQIQKVMIKNKDGASLGSEQLDATSSKASKHQVTSKIAETTVAGVGAESSSSTKSVLSYAAHITYSTPEDASLAILALDKHVFDGRKIRASFGRTKFCKYFLQNATCPARASCPYLHKDCKEQDILTPEDMLRKEELFLQCQQLAIKISKIADMTESQYRNLLEHKRELLCHKNLPKSHQYVLPRVESIFENKELVKNIMLYRRSVAVMKQQAALQQQTNTKKKVAKRKDKKESMSTVVLNAAGQNKLPRSNSYRQQRYGDNEQRTPTINLQDVKETMAGEEQSRRRARNHDHLTEAAQVSEVEGDEEQKIEQFRSRWQKRLVIMSLKKTSDDKEDEVSKQEEQTKQDQSVGRAANRMRLRERRNSVSKSIQRGQRMNSLSSQVEYTLKYVLNDDMAITNTPQYKKEPLIDTRIDETYEQEASQIINKMIMMQQNRNNFEDHFPRTAQNNNSGWPDNQSSYFQSNQDSRYFMPGGVKTEVNLQQIPKTIYTSSCFLINTQNKQRRAEAGDDYESDDQSRRESIRQIWQNFDAVERRLKDSAHHQQLGGNRVGYSSSAVSLQNVGAETQSQKELPPRQMQILPSCAQTATNLHISDSSSSYHQPAARQRDHMQHMLSQRKQSGAGQLLAPAVGAVGALRQASRSHRGSFHVGHDQTSSSLLYPPQRPVNSFFADGSQHNYSHQMTQHMQQRQTSSPDTRHFIHQAKAQASVSKTTQPSGSAAGLSSKKQKKALQQSCSRDALFDDRLAHWNDIFLHDSEEHEMVKRRQSCATMHEPERQRGPADNYNLNEDVQPFDLVDEATAAAPASQSAKKNMHFTSRSVFSFPMLDEEAASKLMRTFKPTTDLEQEVTQRRRAQFEGEGDRVFARSRSHGGSQSRQLLQAPPKRQIDAMPTINEQQRTKKETSAYDEQYTTFPLFSRGSVLRPSSCSKSQSHSRVRRSSTQRAQDEEANASLLKETTSDRSSPVPLRMTRQSYSMRKQVVATVFAPPINLGSMNDSSEKQFKRQSEKTPATTATCQSGKLMAVSKGVELSHGSIENM